MNDEPKGLWGCTISLIEMIGLIIALTWPALIFFLWPKP